MKTDNLNIFTNCYYDCTNYKKYRWPNIKFKNVYLKINYQDLENFDEQIQTNNLILEVIKIDKDIVLEKLQLEKIIKKLKIKRIILSYLIKNNDDLLPELPEFNLIRLLKETSFENVAIDFYFEQIVDGTIMQEKLQKFLTTHNNIKHFSIYLNNKDSKNKLNIPSEFLNFHRYHLHMWALNDYHSTFNLVSFLEKNYLGIGHKAVSRYEDNFYNCQDTEDDWQLEELKLEPKFIQFNDYIDRLSYYYELTSQELKEIYLKIDKKKYKFLLKMNNYDVFVVHDALIEEMLKDPFWTL